MKIAVCIKQVVTREWQLRLDDAKTWIRDQDASWELNEPDAYALEEALRLKEKHGVAHATIVMEVQITGADLRVKRELEGGWFQWVAMPLPAVLTIQSGINQLRYATLKGIMAAKKKDVRTVTPAAPAAARQKILSLYVPERSKKTRMIGGSPAEAAKELVKLLREEARVIS